MSTLEEIQEALGVLAFGYMDVAEPPSYKGFQESFASVKGKKVLQEKVTLLHCTTEYPTPLTDVNLLAMDTLKNVFDLKVGLSDHTEGIHIPIASSNKSFSY